MGKESSAAPEICLEVIHGPMDGRRYVGHKAEVLIGRFQERPDRKTNDLFLDLDSFCSRIHCRIYFEDGQWFIQDLGSTSHTRIRNNKTLDWNTPPEPMNDPDYFIAGSTVVEFSHGTKPVWQPRPKEGPAISPETKKILDRARERAVQDKNVATGADHFFWALAGSDDRAVAEIFSKAGLNPKEIAAQVLDYDRWTGPLLWIDKMIRTAQGATKAAASGDTLAAKGLETPRAQAAIMLADEIRKESGGKQVEPIHLLAGILREGGSDAIFYLKHKGEDADRLGSMAINLISSRKGAASTAELTEETPMAPERTDEIASEAVSATQARQAAQAAAAKPKPQPQQQRPAPQQATTGATPAPVKPTNGKKAAEESKPAPVDEADSRKLSRKPPEAEKPKEPSAPTRGGTPQPAPSQPGGTQTAPTKPAPRPTDHSTWITARQIMDEVIAVQVQFQLADPAARFEALRSKLKEKLSGVPANKRDAVTEQLRLLFPVIESSVEFKFASSGEGGASAPAAGTLPAARPDGRAAALAEEEPEFPGRPKGDTDKWLREIFETKAIRTAEARAGDEGRSFIRLAQLFFRFVKDTDNFTKSLLQTIRGSDGADTQFILPFQTYDLKRLMKKVQENDPKAIEMVADYLDGLSDFHRSMITSYQKALVKWTQEVWDKIKPETIRTESGGWASIIRPQALWETYEKKVRDLDPEIAVTELLQMIDRLTMDEVKRLSEQKKKGEA